MSESSKKASYDREAKVVLVGESGVGKSSLTLRFVTGSFTEATLSTIGASFMSKTIETLDPEPLSIKLNIWDTAGQEKYRSLAALYYRGASCAVLVYDITDRDTFQHAQNYWMSELKTECGTNLVLAVVGNKSDLSLQRVVSIDEGRELAERNNATFFETSALDDVNIVQLFSHLAANLPSLDLKIQAGDELYSIAGHNESTESQWGCMC
jgi:small GTP-binding protein